MGVASTEAILNNYVKLFQKARLEVTVRWGGQHRRKLVIRQEPPEKAPKERQWMRQGMKSSG